MTESRSQTLRRWCVGVLPEASAAGTDEGSGREEIRGEVLSRAGH